MNKKTFTEAADALKQLPPRKFKQTFEFVMNFRDLDLKKPEHQVEQWVQLPHDKGTPTKIGALVGPELAEQAKAACDTVIVHDNFPKYAGDKKAVKKLAAGHTYFIAQANLMADVAKTFGRYFGPRGKMPNPKAGCVVPPNANLKVLVEKLRKTVKANGKLQPSIKVVVGTQDTPSDKVADNMLAVFSSVVQKLPAETANIRSVMLKLSMSSPVRILQDSIVKPVVKAEAPAAEGETKPAKKARKKKAEAAEGGAQ